MTHETPSSKADSETAPAGSPDEHEPPIILLVDDEVDTLSIEEELRSRSYAQGFGVETAKSGASALDMVRDFDRQGREVALFLVDQWMDEGKSAGTDFLHRARKFFPRAIRVLLTAHEDGQAAIDAINSGLLDNYMRKATDPNNSNDLKDFTRKFDETVSQLLNQWESRRVRRFRGVRVVGRRGHSEEGSLLRKVRCALSERLITYEYLDYDEDEHARELAEQHVTSGGPLPMIYVPGQAGPLSWKTTDELEPIFQGLPSHAQELYDLIIVGGGPAGLSAAVFAGSEGLKTCLVESSDSTGGSAAESARVENYLGFPLGIRGRALMNEATAQALSFGVDIFAPLEAEALCVDTEACPKTGDYHKHVILKGLKKKRLHDQISGRAVLLTPGVDFLRLDTERTESNLKRFTSKGIYYGGVVARAPQLRNQHAVVVGGGNSAAQAALHLAKFAREVTMVVRSKSGLKAKTSRYLITEISRPGTNVRVLQDAEILDAFDSLGGAEGPLHHVRLKEGHKESDLNCDAVFAFVGAAPKTTFLKDAVALDERGLILTGQDLDWYDKTAYARLRRDPFWLETSVPGVFAAGDARKSRANQRIASAVGEGSVAVGLVHLFLGPVPRG